jgi:hypothetical protein
MYRKDLLKEWSSGHLASCGWYLNYLADRTPQSEWGLKEKFEDACFNKPIGCRQDNMNHIGLLLIVLMIALGEIFLEYSWNIFEKIFEKIF